MKKYINILKQLNKKAITNGDVPVSCIILYNNKIIARAYNKREYKKNPLLHAEIIAIEKAAKKLKTWNLSECIMISSLKPCNMCKEVIIASKIKEVYYILDNKKIINNKILIKKISTNEYKYFLDELKDFFIDKR